MKMLRTIHLVLCPKAWNCNRHVILLEKLCNNSVSPIGKIKLEVFTNYTCAFIMMVWIKIEVTDNNIHQIFKVYIPTPWTYPSCQHTHPSSGHTYPGTYLSAKHTQPPLDIHSRWNGSGTRHTQLLHHVQTHTCENITSLQAYSVSLTANDNGHALQIQPQAQLFVGYWLYQPSLPSHHCTGPTGVQCHLPGTMPERPCRLNSVGSRTKYICVDFLDSTQPCCH